MTANIPCDCQQSQTFGLIYLTDIKLVALEKGQRAVKIMDRRLLPFIINSLDNEAQSRTDGIHILVHNPLYNCCFPCIVKTTTHVC